ncbi:MAG: DUF2059 domain-containing protein [Alphaproteobacteria bacterium]
MNDATKLLTCVPLVRPHQDHLIMKRTLIEGVEARDNHTERHCMRSHLLAQRAIVALVFLLSAYAPGFAQTGNVDPERMKAARLLLEASRATQTFEDGFKLYQPTSDDYMAQFAERLPDEAARQRFRDTFARVQSKIMSKVMARLGELTEQVAIVYARHFSTEELNTGAAFWRSPVGQKLLARPVTVANILNGSHCAVAPERMQMSRTLVDILKKVDPVTAALLGETPVDAVLPGAGGKAVGAKGLTKQSFKSRAALRFEKLAACYSNRFTADELNALIAFYRSPFSQKQANVGQALDSEVMNIAAQWFEPFRAELETKLTEAVAKGEKK